MENFKEKLLFYKAKYQQYLPALFFVGGFLFDILTLSRIDDRITIIQQAIYLFIIGAILVLRTFEHAGNFHPQKLGKKVWHYHSEVLHFLFGTLLSQYTFFYFLSSSFFTSFVFMILLLGLMLVNEMPQFRNQGPALKFALFTLILISYFSFMVPMVLGFIGLFPIVIAVVISWLVIGVISYIFIKRGLPQKNIFQGVLSPALLVGCIFVFLYFFKFLPPVPLSIQYIGIYQKLEKADDQYILSYERDWWKFWQKGAQTVNALPGDKIYCFIRLFSPTGIKDKISFRWYKKNVKHKWELQDSIENSIVGGREHGFRGFAMKSNFEPGDWKVQVETLDGREIGRIYFTLNIGEPHEREFKIDKY